MAAKERHLHQLHLPLLRGEYVISKPCLFLSFTYSWGFPATHSTGILIYLSPLFFWQSKYKEDTSATHPILLDEPELEVHSFPLHAFSLPCVAMCFLFPPPFFTCLFISSALTSAFLFFFFSFFFSPFLSFRLTLSPILFITP